MCSASSTTGSSSYHRHHPREHAHNVVSGTGSSSTAPQVTVHIDTEAGGTGSSEAEKHASVCQLLPVDGVVDVNRVGNLIIGVRDKTKEIIGVSDPMNYPAAELRGILLIKDLRPGLRLSTE